MSTTRFCVALRTDASAIIGTGHLKRCLSLAVALREVGAEVRLVTRHLGLDIERMMHGSDVEQVLLPAPASTGSPQIADETVPHAGWAGISWHDDAEQTAEALAGWPCTWMVVDHYAFDARWHRQVALRLGARIAAIDDLADRDMAVDVLIDHNHSADHRIKYAGRLADKALLLGGPRFALLGSAYADLQALCVEEFVVSIGIFMGGVDAANLSALALRACREHAGFTGPIEIAATHTYPHLAALAELSKQWPPTTITVDSPDLAGFFSRHGLQIGAGGGATWERCRAGAPTLALVGANNHRAVVPTLAEIGAGASLAEDAPLDPNTVGRAIASLLCDAARRRALAQRARSLVDGLGARRGALALAAESLAVRAAQSDDAARSFEWRNNPETRSVSRDQNEIDWSDHVQWLARTMSDPTQYLMMGHVGDVDVGVIRFELRGDDSYEVSLYLDPALYGLGLGARLLARGEAALAAHYDGGLVLSATVLEGNEVSRRLFARAGYQFDGLAWRKRL